MQHEEYTYHQFKKLPLKATFYRSPSDTSKKTIVYFHGGGLVYGSRTDIPDVYIESFLDAGYHFLTFDYPLAPESSLDEIVTSVKEAVKWFSAESSGKLAIDSSDYILFGRSAGAYLCFLIAKDKSLPSPERIINFYGYDSLDYREFREPSPYYSRYPKLTETIVNRIIQSQPLAEGPLQTRYALYLYARQTGKWTEFLSVLNLAENHFGLTKEDLSCLPPTFIAHGIHDNDVPFHIAQKLKNKIPESYLHSVNFSEHDFDRDSQSDIAREAYSVLFDWLLTNK